MLRYVIDISRYLCSTVVSHTLLPKGSMRQNRKHKMTELEHSNKHQKQYNAFQMNK